jgi:CDP-4-dehydro-6-deoxyglucose reductase, E3
MPDASPTSDGPIVIPPSDASLLDASESAGMRPAYSCRTGRCSTCKAKVLSGKTRVLHDEVGLTAEERSEGWVLTCVRAAETDTVLEFAEVLPDIDLPTPRTLPCRIDALELVTPDVMRVRLRVPPTQQLPFVPGQHLEVIGPGGMRRAYSMANAPREDGSIELHVRHFAGGEMSSYWFEHAAEDDLLRLYGPLGTFVLRDVAGKHVVFLATGTGIAPVAAQLEALARMDAGEAPGMVSAIWGNRAGADIYWQPGAGSVADFVPVLSRADADWGGSTGYVQDVFLAGSTELDDVVVYACGSDAMIRSASAALLAHGLDPHQFHSDAFVSSAPS